jgi:hypothetical protein
MNEIHDQAYAKACQEIERRQLENAKLKEECLELSDQMLSFTGLPGHLHAAITGLAISGRIALGLLSSA